MLETGDTDGRGRRQRRSWALIGLALRGLGLFGALAGCAPPAAAPTWDASPCDPAADYERCDPSEAGLRWRCVATLGVWKTIGYCPQQGLCAAAPLPLDATAGQGTACVAPTADAGPSVDAAAADAADVPWRSTDALAGKADAGAGGLCGNGVCDQEESATSCPSDCAKASCGDGQCQLSEQGTCAYDCSPGAAAAVSCMWAKCPGPAQQCQAKPGCAVALAALWACAQGCKGCLAACLQSAAPDPVVYAVASCGAALCL